MKLTARGRLRRGANARSTRSRRRPGHLATPTSRRASLERRVSEDAVRYSDEPLLCRRPLAFESASVAKGVRRIFPPSCKTRARKGGVPKKHRRNSGVSVAPVAAGLVRQTVDDSSPDVTIWPPGRFTQLGRPLPRNTSDLRQRLVAQEPRRDLRVALLIRRLQVGPVRPSKATRNRFGQ
jgi:hypothetical protein